MRKYTHVIVFEENGEKVEIPASVRPRRAKRKLQQFASKNAKLEKRPVSLKITK